MHRAKGLTLLEVIASLVLVASTAVVLLSAQSRSLERLRTLREAESASHLARELITAWRLDPKAAQSAREGRFDSAPGWFWRRNSRASLLGASTELQEVTLSIFLSNPEGDRLVTDYVWLERAVEQRN